MFINSSYSTTKPLRILQVTEFFTPATGGSTQVVYQLSRSLVKRGNSVTVITSNFNQNDIQFPSSPFEVLRFSTLPTYWKFYITPGLITWSKKHLTEFDVIHMHNVRTFQNAIISYQAGKIGIPYVLSAHGSLPHLGGHQLIKRVCDILFAKRLIHSADQLIAVSQTEVDQYIDAGIPKDMISIIHNGLDLDEFVSLPERGIFRKKYNISNQTKVVLFLGRLHKIKGVNYLIEAFSQVRVQIADAKLVIAGPDDGISSALRELIIRLELSEQVLFTGPIYGREKLSAYIDADVLASPGSYEIFGLVPFEAIMCGTPVVVTDGSGAGNLIKEAQAGYLSQYGDVEMLSSILLRIFSSPFESNQMVVNGQEYIRQNLSWQMITEDLERLYHHLTAIKVD